MYCFGESPVWSRRRCGQGVSPVPAQMWQGGAQSWCRWVAGASFDTAWYMPRAAAAAAARGGLRQVVARAVGFAVKHREVRERRHAPVEPPRTRLPPPKSPTGAVSERIPHSPVARARRRSRSRSRRSAKPSARAGRAKGTAGLAVLGVL